MLHAIALKTLIAVMLTIGTIDSHLGQKLVVWALQHQVPSQPCHSDWHGYVPTREVYTVYTSSCQLLWSISMTSEDRAQVLADLRPEW